MGTAGSEALPTGRGPVFPILLWLLCDLPSLSETISASPVLDMPHSWWSSCVGGAIAQFVGGATGVG